MAEDIGRRKLCFVTIGATAAFDSLIKAALEPTFIQALQQNGYTDLRLQHGRDGAFILKECLAKNGTGMTEAFGLNITGFDFNTQGLGVEMRAAKAGEGAVEGVVISHAGSGSVLDALRIAIPLIVVPNPSLLNNHQEELAEAMAQQGYAVHGNIHDLPAAIKEIETIRDGRPAWPPETNRRHGEGLVGIMDDEMGFVD
ncbi:MAG: hypothetical protein Q9163_000054 [Psora crenata]